MDNWQNEEVSISEIKRLLDEDYEIEVDSPDGYVPVNFYVDKGQWDEYILTTMKGKTVVCNENHLFQTTNGWEFAKDLDICVVWTDEGWCPANVTKTGNKVPIVDINVDHNNHRYYTNGVSSHNTGVGKTMFMTHCAAANLMEGYNVLYITMEMAEERIAERIDANLLDVTLDDLRFLNEQAYVSRIGKVKSKTTGKLIIKEYPTASAGSNHFRFLLNELKLKRNFVPDIIYVDYLNICSSSRVKFGGTVNSYSYIKSIAEELRGLAVEFNVPVISATQMNRDGLNNSDADLTNTSESIALPATVDMMFALISSEELEERGQVMVKQLKNRWGDISNPKRFVVGVDRSKMMLFDVEESAQDDILNENKDKKKKKSDSVMDNTGFGERWEEESKMPFMKGKPNFGGFK